MEDKGHVALVQDVTDLRNEVMTFQFHDFKNEHYPAPKIELRNRLIAMADAVVDGKYDN